MKQIKIHTAIDEQTGKIGTQREFIGYDINNISDQLEILGALQNLVDIQKDVIKTFGRKKIA